MPLAFMLASRNIWSTEIKKRMTTVNYVKNDHLQIALFLSKIKNIISESRVELSQLIKNKLHKVFFYQT